MALNRAERLGDRVEGTVERLGDRLVRTFQLLALFVIGGTIVWSAAADYLGMIAQGSAGIHDILLLFIYLELGAMVGIYFRTNELPVEFLLYVAITVITRTLVEVETMGDSRVIVLAVSILVLAGAALLLRYGASRFQKTDDGEKAKKETAPPG